MCRYLLLAMCLFPLFACAAGLSPYLPLNISPEAEAQIERVMALTPAVPLSKPYKAVELHRRLKLIRDSHPALYASLSKYLSRYTQSRSVTHASAAVSFSDNGNLSLPNQRNMNYDASYQVSLSSLAQLNPYFYGAAGFSYDQSQGLTHYGTHFGVGNEFLQMELGYREHWFSPFYHSAMLVSTHAPASPSITLSNATPYTNWNIRFEIFYSMLEQVEEIVLGDERFPGRPRHAGLHLSFTPLDFWTIGLNRTLQFGGGQREVGIDDVFQALFDPAGKDNVGDVTTDDPNFEFGNQQASVTTRFNFHFGTPMSLYAEYAGEDTVNESNFQLGNDALSVGIYLPMVTDSLSLRYEFSDWSDRWYVHHLYPAGYSNEGQLMGHWAAALRTRGEDTPATAQVVNLNWQFAANQLLDATFSMVNNQNTANTDYVTSYQAQLRYSAATRYGFWGVTLNAGNDPFDQRFYRLSAFYRW